MFVQKKAIIKAAKRIINSDKMCRSYSDLNFGVTFFGTQCTTANKQTWRKFKNRHEQNTKIDG